MFSVEEINGALEDAKKGVKNAARELSTHERYFAESVLESYEQLFRASLSRREKER